MSRSILHCDMNNFYASVECMLDPVLKKYPVAVCGSVEERHGIVLAKNYAAKAFGIKTGDAVWQAKQKCRNLVVVPPHFEEYIKYPAYRLLPTCGLSLLLQVSAKKARFPIPAARHIHGIADGGGVNNCARKALRSKIRRRRDRIFDQHCVSASGCLVSIIKCLAFMMISRLHFGQKSGNAFNSVSGKSCRRVFAPHIGHKTHLFSSAVTFMIMFPTFCIRIRFSR